MVVTLASRPSGYIGIRPLGLEDAGKLSRLLTADPPEYTRHFHPFAFTVESIRERIRAAKLDQYFAIELRAVDETGAELVGFYMLRGLDEGFKDPMYGVYICAESSGLGIGHLTLLHAECYCKMHGLKKILLKVHPDNLRARNLYETQGFHYLRDDPGIGNQVLYKNLEPKK